MLRIYFGDINNDGIINMLDAFAVYTAASTGDITPAVNRSGDVTKDGQIDMRDAFNVYRTASGG